MVLRQMTPLVQQERIAVSSSPHSVVVAAVLPLHRETVLLAVRVAVVLVAVRVAQEHRRKGSQAVMVERETHQVVVVAAQAQLATLERQVSVATAAQVSRQASQVRRSLVLVAVVVVAGIMSLIVGWAAQAAVATAQALLLSHRQAQRTQAAVVAAAAMTVMLAQVATAVRVSSSSAI